MLINVRVHCSIVSKRVLYNSTAFSRFFYNVFCMLLALDREQSAQKFQREILTAICDHELANGRAEMALEKACLGFVKVANEGTVY